MIVTKVERTPQKTLPRARTNGRGGPGAYVFSMVPPPILVKSPHWVAERALRQSLVRPHQCQNRPRYVHSGVWI